MLGVAVAVGSVWSMSFGDWLGLTLSPLILVFRSFSANPTTHESNRYIGEMSGSFMDISIRLRTYSGYHRSGRALAWFGRFGRAKVRNEHRLSSTSWSAKLSGMIAPASSDRT